MAKKIDSTLTALIKALVEHGNIVGGHDASLKKSQRAAVEVQDAARAYAEAVERRTGHGGLFDHIGDPLENRTGLDDDTVRSLNSERDAIKAKK